MSIVNKPFTFSPNTSISSSQMNSNFDDLYDDYNGGISAANLANNAVTTDKIADDNVTAAKIADGAIDAAAKINDDVVTPAKWTNPYCFSAYDSAGTTLSDGGFVQINLGTENYDYNSNFATNAYTAPVAGVYSFSGQVTINGAIASPVNSSSSIRVNGVEVCRGTNVINTASNTAVAINRDLLLAANDVVTLYGYQDSGGAEATLTGALYTWFSGSLVNQV